MDHVIYPLVSGIMVPVSAFLIDRFSTRVSIARHGSIRRRNRALCSSAYVFPAHLRSRAASSRLGRAFAAAVVPMLVFPVEKRGTAMGVAGIVMSAGPAVGPCLAARSSTPTAGV